MGPKEILESTRKAIAEHAGDDPDKRFYANRFLFPRSEAADCIAQKKRPFQGVGPKMLSSGVLLH
jgi:hypothetical protein